MEEYSLEELAEISQQVDSASEGLRAILEYFYILIQQYFIKTRNFENGMRFCEMGFDILEDERECFSDFEYKKFDEKLIRLKLKMYDYLNLWDEYISYSDYILNYKPYVTLLNPYDKSGKYLIETESGPRYHFLSLYEFSSRYDVIRRKIEKRDAGKNVDHLKRHQQDELTEEEIERRTNLVKVFFCHFHYDTRRQCWRWE